METAILHEMFVKSLEDKKSKAAVKVDENVFPIFFISTSAFLVLTDVINATQQQK